MRKSPVVLAIVMAFLLVVVLREERNRQPTAPDGTPVAEAATEPASASGPSANEQALADAREQGRPVLLSFRSASCIPCRAMGDVLAAVEPRYRDRIAFVHVSLDGDSPDWPLIEQYQVRVKPTTVLVDGDGNAAETHLGVWEEAELAARLDALGGG